MQRSRRTAVVALAAGLVSCAGGAVSAPPPVSDDGGPVALGDDKIRVVLVRDSGALRESSFSVEGAVFPALEGVPWTVEVDGKPVAPGAARLVRRNASQAVFAGEAEGFSWEIDYALRGPGRITKTLRLNPTRDAVLDRAWMWDARGAAPAKVARTSRQDIAAFYRQGGRGLFVSLDYPYSEIRSGEGSARVGYPPFDALKAGSPYAVHSLTFGAVRLSGRERYGPDDGEVAAMDAYVQGRFPPRFERPMVVASGINNRFTQVGDAIWYTMKDHPTFSFHADLLKRELSLMARLGVEHYQSFPGVFDWAPGDPAPAVIEDVVRHARREGVRIGDYSGTQSVFCPHYNEYGNTLPRPEWVMENQGGPLGLFCLGHPDFARTYGDTVAAAARRFGFEMHCLDFLAIQPCSATTHGHPAGRDGVYRQVRGLVSVLEAINAVSPEMMTWSNSGNWTDFLPKLAWYNPNLYLTDPHVNHPWPGLNMTRILDDVRRQQMVEIHHTTFLPYRFFTNYQYFLSMNSVVPDIRNYRYGVLSTLAVTPNLGLGEIRQWIDRLPAPEAESVIAFYRKWTGFVRTHYALWKTTFQAGDNPGPGGVEIYGHASGDHGFVFLVNPDYFGKTVDVPLDGALGFSAVGACEIAELHPVERLRLTAQGPFARFGTRLPVHVPAQQTMVLEVRRAPERIDMPRLYGIPGTVRPENGGVLVKTFGPQGRKERFAVLLPPGSPALTGASVRDLPKQPKRLWAETPVRALAQGAQGTLFEVAFRRTPAPTELRDWAFVAGDLEDGLRTKRPAGFSDGRKAALPLYDFCGAYIDNALSEEQETWIDLKAGGSRVPGGDLLSGEASEPLPPPDEAMRNSEGGWWLQTRFHLPFMHQMGFEPYLDEHAILVLPLLREAEVKSVRAWINGVPLDVRRYAYPMNPALGCRYADLVGSGAAGGRDNLLVVHVQ